MENFSSPRTACSNVRRVRWERFFEDLQDQFDAEWDAERTALAAEAERLRLSRVTLRNRLVALASSPGAPLAVDIGGESLIGRVSAVGQDWAALQQPSGATAIVRLDAVIAVTGEQSALARSALPSPGGTPSLTERMPLGYLLRDLARRRAAITLTLRDGTVVSGTADRAGADHLDLALHEPGTPRRAASVTGLRLVMFAAVRWLRWEPAGS